MGVASALDPKSVVLQFYALMTEGKYEDAFKLVRDDFDWWMPGDGSVGDPRVSGTINKAEYLQALSLIVGKVDGGITFEPGLVLVEGNRLAMTGESRAQLKNGRTYKNHFAIFLEVRDGQIAWVKEYVDTKHVHDVLLAS